MKLARKLSDAEEKKVQSLILITGGLTTLTVWTSLEDPVNLPKLFVLVLGAVGVFGFSIPVFLNFRSQPMVVQILTVLISLFCFGLLASTFMTDVLYTAIYGEAGRNNGALQYLSLAVILLSTAFVFRDRSVIKFLKFYSITGIILAGYGLMQAVGLDPISWKIFYNPIITTLGNPNFTSSFIGTASVAIASLILMPQKKYFQMLLSVSLILSLYILFKSGSIQGVFGFLIGLTILITTRIWLAKKLYGQVALISVSCLSLTFLAGVLNKGPLAELLYQGTLRNRLDYWYAAINMFERNRLFGIGLDRFGENYRQYSVQNQLVKEQVTDNAHNIYLQILSTGGLSLFIPFLSLICFISYIGFKEILRSENTHKYISSSVFAIWFSSCSIGLVSIDNLGLSVWMWISGGVVVANARNKIDSHQSSGKKTVRKEFENSIADSSSNLYPRVLVYFLLLLTLVVSVPTLTQSYDIHLIRISSSQLDVKILESKFNSSLESNWDNPQNLIKLSTLAFNRGFNEIGEKAISRNLVLDPRSYYGYYFKALIAEGKNDLSSANLNRVKLLNLAPWNTANMLQIGTNYITLGDKERARLILLRIAKLYPGSPDDLKAKEILRTF